MSDLAPFSADCSQEPPVTNDRRTGINTNKGANTQAKRAANQAAAQQLSKKIHSFILNRLPKPGAPLHAASAHHFAKSGKMLRAKMALQAADMLGVDKTAAMHWAVAIEVLHNASLVHDDICDGDKLRRGRPAVWAKYGRDVALTLGDWLIALSFELAAEAAQRTNTPMLVKMLAQHMKTTTAGEAREFDMLRGSSWQDYLQIAADKTAPLLTAPLEGVALMALHGTAAPVIGVYFRFLGNAYQIANDIMNFRGSDGAATSGSDLGRRAPNAVISVFRETLKGDDKAAFDNWYNSGSNDELKAWQNAMVTSGAIDETARRMKAIIDQTKRCANELPLEIAEVVNPVQDLLEQVCQKATGDVHVAGDEVRAR